MAEATLPLPAKVHAALARALDWLWPRGAPWGYADAHARGLGDALRRFAELRPGEGEVQVLVGAVLRRCGRQAEALRAFRLAVRLGSLPVTRRFALGEAILGTEGWQAALAAWNEARQIEAASGSLILRNAGRRSALNFHPGQPMGRLPKREAPPPPRGPLTWVRERRVGVRAAVLSLFRREWRGKECRVRAIRSAWRKAHPGLSLGLHFAAA